MHKLLGNESPSRKVSGTLGYMGKRAKYVATPTRENVVIREGEEIVGGIYVSNRLVRGLGIGSEKIDVFGEWEDFDWVVLDKNIPNNVKISWDRKGIGTTNRVKGVKYRTLDDARVINDLSLGKWDSVEDFLYRNVPIEELEKKFDLSWAKKKNYRILTEDDEIYEWLEGLDKTEDIVGFDTETTGLLANRSKLDKLVGISMSYEDHGGVYFPIRQARFENVKMGEEKLLELLRPYCDRNSDKAKDLVTHNGGFDWKVMHMSGMDLNIVHDTYLRISLMDSRNNKVSKLKEIVKVMFGYDTVELEDMYERITPTEIEAVYEAVMQGKVQAKDITKRKLSIAKNQDDLMDFQYASKEFVELYGPGDADFPRMVHKKLNEEWDDKLNFIYKLETNLIPNFSEQEYYGVRIIEEGFNKLHEQAINRINKLKERIYEEAGEVFNINSGKQLGNILFEKLGCPKKDKYKTKTGAWGTSKDVLKDLSYYKDDKGDMRFPIVKYLQEHSKVSKLINSFYEKLPEMAQKGYIFTQYNQVGAKTGRVSNSQPNLQQTEETSRFYMIPDTKDHYFLICDYSQIEYRIMAAMAKEHKVIDFFKNDAEADYHIKAYSNMMKKPYEEVTPEERSTGKTLNFGTSYGLEDRSLAMQLYGNDSMFAQKKAREARKDYLDGVPNIRDYFEEVKDIAMEKTYSETLFGRRRYITEFENGTHNLSEYRIASGRRKAGNHPVQGTAADIMKIALARVRKIFRSKGYGIDKVRIVMNIHDEIVLQVHKSINMWYAVKLMREAMEIDLSKLDFPPLYIGAVVGESWGDGENDTLEAPVYLMDEKIEEVEKMLAEGKELPTYDNPKEVWEKEITYYALRVIKYELGKGYKDKGTGKMKEITCFEDAMKNVRLSKYSNHFGDVSDAVVMELMSDTPNNVMKRLNNIEKYLTKRSAISMKRIRDEINNNDIQSLEEASKNSVIIEEMNYFGEHKWTVVKRLFNEKPKEVFYTLHKQIKSEGYEKIEYEVVKTKEGKDITAEVETLNNYIKKKLVRYNKKNNVILLRVDYDDIDLFNILEGMLVPITSMEFFKEQEKRSSFILEYENGTKYSVKGYRLFHKFIPLLFVIMKMHVTGVGYQGIPEKIEEIGSTLVKGAEELDKGNSIEELEKEYMETQTSEYNKTLKSLGKKKMVN